MEGLQRGIMETEKGDVSLLVTGDGKYRVWVGRDGRIRWALADWPDDGWAIRNHGSASTVEEAQAAISEHRALVESLPR